MAAFDLTRIVESLQSAKLKSRNDALALLDGFSVEKLRLTPLQLASLVAALLKAIEAERDAYARSNANLAVARAISASGFLRDLVQASLGDSLALRPRQKTCSFLISSLSSLYFEPSTMAPFSPCSSNFAQTLCSLLEAPAVFTRLTVDTWLAAYHFLLKAIAYELEFIGAHGINENLVSSLYAGLLALIGGPLTLGVAPLLRDGAYFPLLHLLTKTLAHFNRRESAVLVTAFKIINALLASLCTEDAAFLHQIIRVGTGSALQFSSTSVANLLEQLFLFLNQDSFHMYLSLEKLPKLVSTKPEVASGDAMLEEDVSFTAYNLEMLIYALINRLVSLALSLTPENVGLHESSHSLSLFSLSKMYLRSENSMSWLLASAISRLVASYYRIRDMLSSSDQRQNESDESYSTKSFSVNSFKRHKLHDRQMGLQNATSCIQFYNSLVNGEDPKLQKCGLQLLAFHLQLDECCFSTRDSRAEPNQSSALFDPTDSTVADNNLYTDTTIPEDWLSMISGTVKLMADRNHSFWALLVCHSLLNSSDYGLCSERPALSRKLYQVLKLLLELIKDNNVGQIACSVFSCIISSQSSHNLKCLIDHTIFNQLDNVAELPDILGPALADSSAVSFWQALAHVYVVLGHEKRNLPNNISKWLAEKWRILSGKGTIGQLMAIAETALQIIIWLGRRDHNQRIVHSTSIERDFILEAMKDCEELKRFITLQSYSEKPRPPHRVVSPKLGNAIDSINLIIRCFDVNSQLCFSDENFEYTVSLSMMHVRFAENLRLEFPEYSSTFEDNARNILLSLTPNIRTKEQALLVLSVLFQCDPAGNILHDVAFPFEIIDYHFRFLLDRSNRRKDVGNDLEAEFANDVKIRDNLPTAKSPKNVIRDRYDYFKFLAKYADSKPETCIEYMSELPSSEILECLSFYVTSGLLEKHKQNSSAMVGIVRLIGEKLLATQDLDRSNFTIFISCHLLGVLLPLMNVTLGDELKKDILDLIGYFFQCAERDLLLSVLARTYIWNLLLDSTKLDCNTPIATTKILSVFLKQLTTFSNGMKIAVSKSIHGCISEWDSPKQQIFLEKLNEIFESPQRSIESYATFCLFLAKVSSASIWDAFTISCIMKYCRFTFAVPFSKKAVSDMAKNHGFSDSKTYFKTLRLDILKSWWLIGHPFSDFPHEIFGYPSKSELMSDNAKHMMAVLFATRCRVGSSSTRQSNIDSVAQAYSTNEAELIYDSLPLTIGLSYTPGGVRSEIFGLLKSLLQSHYKEYIQEMLPLIVLEVIKMTDLTNEVSIKKIFKEIDAIKNFVLKAPENYEGHTYEIIDPVSSIELISALIKSFWPHEPKRFWSLQTVYFFARQIGHEGFSMAVHMRARVLNKLRFLLLLSNTRLLNFHLIKLVVKICIPIIKDGFLFEAQAFLSQIDFDQFQLVSHDQSLPMIFNILATMLSVDENERYHFETVCQHLENFISTNNNCFGSAQKIVKCALNSARNQAFEITLNDVENLLGDKRNLSVVAQSTEDILVVFSKLLSGLDCHPTKTATHRLASMYLRNPPQIQSDEKFTLWVAEYLANFYLCGLAHTNLEDFFLHKEYSELSRMEFASACKTLNPFLHHLTQALDKGIYREETFVESVIGNLLQKFEIKKRDITRYIDFDACFEHFSSHILPISVRSSALLNLEIPHETVTGTSVELFVNDFESIVVILPFKTWTCQFLLCLLQEMCRNLSIAPILERCILKLPNIAKNVLPSFICYYVFNSGGKAIETIIKFFRAYWSTFHKPFCQQSIELVKTIAITLRMGAMQDIENFKTLYGALNHIALFQIVRESYLPKSALMFFEDSLTKPMDFLDWTDKREPLAMLYSSLNDEDSLSGIPGDSTLEGYLKLRQEFLPPSEKLGFSSGLLDASFILKESPQTGNIIESLLNEGYLGVSKLLCQKSEDNSQAEWSWKLNQWEMPINEKSSNEHDVTYAYFKQIRENSYTIHETYRSSMKKLIEGIPIESGSNKYSRQKLLAREKWLESIALIKSANSIMSSTPTDFSSEIRSFEAQTKWFNFAEIQSFEDILLARRLAFSLHDCSFLKSQKQSSLLELNLEFASFCRQGEVNEIVRYNSIVRQRAMPQKAINSCLLLEKVVKSMNASDLRNYEEYRRLSSFQIAQTLWSEGKMDGSVALLQNLASQGDILFPLSVLNVSKMSIKAQLAVWLAESRLELGSNILDRIVEPMKAEIDQVCDMDQRYQIYHLLAHFCELQFRSLILKEQLMQLEIRTNSRKEELQELKTHYSTGEALSSERSIARAYYENLKSLYKSESKELLTMLELRTSYAHNAVKFYLKALTTAKASDEDFEKFFSLFLELSGDEVLQASIQEELFYLPSHQPLAWCSQILSRVSKEATHFQHSIQNLIFKICCDHPFHSLYYLTSLLFHERLAKDTSSASMISRIVAATKIKNKLHLSSPQYASKYLLPVERFSTESVLLAEMRSSRGRTLQLDKLKIGSYWMNELPSIPPPTLEIPVDITGYANVPRMTKLDPKIQIASSGISLPKVATFTLSDGTRHKMLLKHGTDDLRQDAIMEQVFGKVNKIFRKDKETRKRKLRVRTYRAVPLGPKAGVIEFVPDSKALFEVILPYHQAKDSMKLDKAREMMKNSQANILKDRLKVYQNIEEKIRPVLRYFFLTNFVTPDSWFASRQIYIRGVATSSIVGHILGLGDRHCNNILLDEFTGEPIHIDLGVAFDQGKRLKVPETVPFRLTRDVVDGFGYMGCAGPFTKVSEHTFRVLRTSRDHILAILDVLRWDPLYSWSISPIRQRKLQDENAGVINPEAKQDGSAATKAIIGVSDKLSAGGLNVEAAVRELIREAVSEQNLAAIYCGWCPFY
ncbi:hypothetical protein METBIDRAFT_86246 [Metschnikowia bicuspidata var. bicuspidata NRRL YB-4993]|uniref:Serine/threonine-protein kinase Tel1 n=1 Tax=Metschnikowia bicuspidata var. bicuspidata NRRL YB-4993 TaxID=869754 RepID=A0A1A0HJ86_9ASCO|nr:hypothetical protein METBIDRAFT_86246 [Metschnikowia bicuspidata var. bicuspidata NRRL YB-4993]OBA24219.1 hypothetical protein METBIDRAFT_86246 [Metschnikowia bicuspidata var. bicuspidata NRRL YB-4993]